jgi:hypothetical protein
MQKNSFLIAYEQTVRVDIVMIDETWFTGRHSDDDLSIVGFVLFRSDRCGRKVTSYVFMFETQSKYCQFTSFEALLISQLSENIESVMSNRTDFILIIAGDFNNLCTDFLKSNYGFDQLVLTPTHRDKLIDKFFVSRPDLYCASAFRNMI